MTTAHTINSEQTAAELGRKLGALLAALEVSDEAREAMLKILPELTLEQLSELVVFLETSAVHAETMDLDQELRQEIERIKMDYDAAEAKLNAQASVELEAVAAKLKSQ